MPISSDLMLGIICGKLQRTQIISERIALCEAALNILGHEQDPTLWVNLQIILGDSLLENTQGERADNLERAIVPYKEILQTITYEAMPNEWVMVTNRLADIYVERIHGDLIENQEKAIELYEQVLPATYQSMPSLWVRNIINLSSMHLLRTHGKRADNLEKVVSLCEKALKVATRKTMLHEWALLTINLAFGYSERILGEHSANLEQAVDLCQQVLQEINRQSMPDVWARATLGLANAYKDRIHGARAENLELAIKFYQRSLEIFLRQYAPIEWAQITSNLALTYLFRIKGDRSKNIEQAITLNEQALEVLSRQSLPAAWAKTTMNLALVYQSRIHSERATNLEKAIKLHLQALQIMTFQSMPDDWATATLNLALAFSDRLLGDSAENQERAIELNKQALKLFTQNSHPIKWATVTMNLARVHNLRTHGKRSENLKIAIELYEQVLQVFTQDTQPIEWAQTINNLALTYDTLSRGMNLDNQDKAENQERAIILYHQALVVRGRESLPTDWAETTMNLANSYSLRIRGIRTENQQQAIALYQQALEIVNRQTSPIEWANIMTNLANAYCLGDKQTTNLQRAIECARESLVVYQVDSFIEEHRRVQNFLGHIYFHKQQWSESSIAFTAASQANERLYRTVSTPEARNNQLIKLKDVPAQHVYALLKTNPDTPSTLQQAVLILERNRARWLNESLALQSERPASVTDDLWQQFVDLGKQIQMLQTESRLPEDTPAKRSYVVLSELLRDVYQQLEKTVQQIRNIAPEFMPQPTFDRVQIAAKQCPIVYIMATSAGGLVLIVNADQVSSIWLNGFTDERLYQMVSQWLSVYNQRPLDRERWFETIEKTTRQLWDEVMGPIAETLRSSVFSQHDSATAATSREITLIPFGLLSLLPLHAAWAESNSIANDLVSGNSRKYFFDDFAVRYVPSAISLSNVQTHLSPVTGGQTLVVQDPQPVKAPPLPSSEEEAKAISAYFDNPLLLRHQQATHTDVLTALSQTEVAHFACHGSNNWREPLESGVILANNEFLSVRDLLAQKLPSARLATLSACETAIVGTELPDEVLALPTALLQAGFEGVIASLWVVADFSTAMLMARFYDLWRKEFLEPIQALAKAQQWLRDTTNREKAIYFRKSSKEFYKLLIERDPKARDFAHPFWWSAFTFTGL